MGCLGGFLGRIGGFLPELWKQVAVQNCVHKILQKPKENQMILGVPGASWRGPGGVLGCPGAFCGRLGASWGRLGGILVSLVGVLGVAWGLLGAS